jgi:transcriptional regulator with GAF, ATPase, and Fis domain
MNEQQLSMRCVVLASADAGLRSKLTEDLTGLRWTVRGAVGGADAMAQVEEVRPEALLVDSWLPDLEVAEFSAQMMSLYPAMDVLRVDGSPARQGSGGQGARSPRRNELLHVLRLAQEHGPVESASSATPYLMATVVAPAVMTRPAESLPEMIGESAVMRELARVIRLVAPRNATVLIEGETGTGKEIVAKAVHRLSARSGKSFTVLNCAAIPESLLEAELFGHTRGAFTGAVQSRTGRIEAAHGGTLFLDEIGEMPLALQAKMLRFLECGELQRVGDNETMRVDVRVIAATHQHLEERAMEGLFRLDLYHRLAVFPVEVSPLRERIEDLPLLVEFFLEEMGKEMPRKTISGEALAKLKEYAWPGNVRELKHVLERASILVGDSALIGVDEIRLRARVRG